MEARTHFRHTYRRRRSRRYHRDDGLPRGGRAGLYPGDHCVSAGVWNHGASYGVADVEVLACEQEGCSWWEGYRGFGGV